MNPIVKRVVQIEKRGPCLERRFVGWNGNPWTPDQMTVAIRQHPQQFVFWRSRWEMLTTELKRFEYQIPALGGIRYSAPSGYHDDCVMALALAVYRKWEVSRAGSMFSLPQGRGIFGLRPGAFRRPSRCIDG